jgi:hypothetical protein
MGPPGVAIIEGTTVDLGHNEGGGAHAYVYLWRQPWDNLPLGS